jgi:hypothetical protein
MHLLENPFHVLGVSPRDDRRRIVELAEERSLSLDPAMCAQARADLTNPRNRIAAEVAWLPGLDPDRAGQLVEAVRQAASSVDSGEGLSALARANLLAALLSRMEGSQTANALPARILELATLWEACDAEWVRALINEDRTVSGFPEVRDTSSVEEALGERRGYFRTALKSALDGLPPLELVDVVTRVVTEATADGSRHAPALVDDLVSTYEVEAQRFLDAEARNVELLVEAVREGVAREVKASIIQHVLTRIGEVVNSWDRVAQPIQLSAKSRGVDHELSLRAAAPVRGLAVDLVNEHGRIEEAKFLTDLLQRTFLEVPRVAEVTGGDLQALQDISQRRESSRREWAREIFFETELGVFFKDKLKISESGIEWKDRSWPLESITRVSWGGVSDQYGSTHFTVAFGDLVSSDRIDTSDQRLYSTLLEKLWPAVCHRLLMEMVVELGRGGRFAFGNLTVEDGGVTFVRNQFFGDPIVTRASWNDVTLQSVNGSLVLKHRWDSNGFASLSYLDVDNTHILEAAVRKLFTTQNSGKLSDLLRGA